MSVASMEQIKNTGAPLMNRDIGAVDAMKGVKARFSFRCPSCTAVHETAGEYALTQNMGKVMVKSQVSSSAGKGIGSILSNIPVIGPLLGSLAGQATRSAVDSAMNSGAQDPIMQARDESFKEIESKFQVCSSCGKAGCVNCMKDGRCSACTG